MITEALRKALASGIEDVIRDMNPWWRGERLPGAPPMRRWAFGQVLDWLKTGPTSGVVLRGPRQVGKSVLMTQVLEALLGEGVDGRRILHVQFDRLESLYKAPLLILELARWYAHTILGKSLNQAAIEGGKTFLLLDEIQNVPEWDVQLKHLLDTQPVRAFVTGSSSLRIEAGRDSLAGRIRTFEMGPLLLREIAELRGSGRIEPYLAHNGLAPLREKDFWRGLREYGLEHAEMRRETFAAFSVRGGYPIAHVPPDQPLDRIADALNETVIRRAIGHDLRMGPRGRRRDAQLLEEVFRLACRYVGQSPSEALYLDELRRALDANIGWQRVLAYLKFLDGTLLLRLIEPLELRLKRRRGASKLCLCDHALRAAWLQEVVPLTPEGLAASPHLADLAGHIAESAAGYFLRSIVNLDVAHFPARSAEPEVDFVLTVGEQRVPLEVKYRRWIDHRDTLGLRSFIEKTHYNAPFGVLVTMLDDVASDDPRIVSLPLSSLLLLR